MQVNQCDTLKLQIHGDIRICTCKSKSARSSHNQAISSNTLKMKALLVTVACPFMLMHLHVTAWALSIDQAAALDKQDIKMTKSHETKTIEVATDTPNSNQRPDMRRPIWNMAHMVNSIKELDYRLEKGANSIEVDITFGRDGDPLYTYHGPPCDCWRHCHQQEDFSTYLAYVRHITVDEPNELGKNLYVMLLDLKLDPLTHRAKAHAGTELARLISTILFGNNDNENDIDSSSPSHGYKHNNKQKAAEAQSRSPLRIVVSINHITDVDLVQHFIHYLEQNNATHLMDRIGFDVGMNDDLELIETMWRRFGSSLNLWQGDGFTNCFSPFYNLKRLSRAIVKRNTLDGYPHKVYHWTIDMHDRMRESLTMGSDVIMTNHPERLLTILKEPDIAHDFRMANRDDDPFKKIILKSGSKSSETARFERSASGPVGSGFLGGLMDVVSSWWTWLKEIPFLSLPTTSRFMPKFRRHKVATNLNVKSAPEQEAEYRTTSLSSNLTTLSSPSTTASTTKTATITTAASSTNTTNDGNQTSISETTAPPTTTVAEATTTKEPPLEKPSWFASFASNMLVSALKIVLPENKNNQSST